MPSKRPPGSLGLDLRSRGLRPCGLCGETRKMSRAHVPPRAAGNGADVTSAIVLISNGVLRSGRHAAGGMWLKGLCAECNSLAGARYDDAYADFSRRIQSYLRMPREFHLADRSGAPAVSVAPGLVARSVMFGMFAISPNLRIMFPELADQLRDERAHIAMPDGLSLRFALYRRNVARLTGPVHSFRVLNRREHYSTFAEIFFRPLAWVAAPAERYGVPDAGVSIMDRQRWPSANEWLHYGSDVTSTDLRNLCRFVPQVGHPLAESRQDWIELYNNEITPFVEGIVPN
jgi:hypothetical protein